MISLDLLDTKMAKNRREILRRECHSSVEYPPAIAADGLRERVQSTVVDGRSAAFEWFSFLF